MGQVHQAAALQHGDMLSYRVDLLYIRPAPEQVRGQLFEIFYL